MFLLETKAGLIRDPLDQTGTFCPCRNPRWSSGSRIILIDTGFPGSADAILKAMAQLGCAPGQGREAPRRRGRHLLNEYSIRRLVGVILLEQNDEWQLQHRYMTIETMAGRNDEPTALTHIAA